MYQPDHATRFAPTARAGLLGLLAPFALSSIERTVIALARNEADQGRWDASPSRLAPLRWLARLGRAITGQPPRVGLADERLETLRRFAAMIRRKDGRAGRVAEALRDYGYRPDQLAAIEVLARG